MALYFCFQFQLLPFYVFVQFFFILFIRFYLSAGPSDLPVPASVFGFGPNLVSFAVSVSLVITTHIVALVNDLFSYLVPLFAATHTAVIRMLFSSVPGSFSAKHGRRRARQQCNASGAILQSRALIRLSSSPRFIELL